MKTDNITLIGMPGAGKSTVGVILAKVLGYEFIDPDLLIQKKEGMLLSEIIAKKGEKEFLNIESRVNEELDCKGAVIAPGGSVIYEPAAMAHLQEISNVVYLNLDIETIEKRVANVKKRGVVLKEGQTLRDLYNERHPLYEKYADIVIDANLPSPEDVLTKICEIIGK